MGQVIQMVDRAIYRVNRAQLKFIEDVRERYPKNIPVICLIECYYAMARSKDFDDDDKTEHLKATIASIMKTLNIAGMESDDGYAILGGFLMGPQAFRILKLIYQVHGKYKKPVSVAKIKEYNTEPMSDFTLQAILDTLTKKNFILNEKLLQPSEGRLRTPHYEPGSYTELYFDINGIEYVQ